MGLEESLQTALEPLLTAIGTAQALRLTARPGAVIIDKPGAVETVTLLWDEARHDAAKKALGDATVRLPSGITAVAAGDAIVLRATQSDIGK